MFKRFWSQRCKDSMPKPRLYIYIYIYIYAIMKTMCPAGYHHNSFVTTHALGHEVTVIIFLYTFLQNFILQVKVDSHTL